MIVTTSAGAAYNPILFFKVATINVITDKKRGSHCEDMRSD